MLSDLPPDLRSFLRRLPLGAAAALALWFAVLGSVWAPALTFATEKAIRAIESPKVTMLSWERSEAAVAIQRSDFSTQSDVPGYRNLDAISGNAVLLLALVFATPGLSRGSTLFRSGLALLALFLSHVVHFLVAIEMIYATQLGEWSTVAYAPWKRETLGALRYFFDLVLRYAIPVVVYVLFVFIPRRRELEDEEAAVAGAAGAPKSPRKHRKKR